MKPGRVSPLQHHQYMYVTEMRAWRSRYSDLYLQEHTADKMQESLIAKRDVGG